MHLRRLVLHSFRNVDQIEVLPHSGFNILWGENAQGKTNFLEAIYLLGHLKSFRTTRNRELIRKGYPFGRISGEVEEKEVRHTIAVVIQEEGKTIRVDGKPVTKTMDFPGYLRSVLFAPEEVGLARGFPAGRRALLDRAVFQADPAFLDRAREYQRCLKQRNRLLKEGASPERLLPWSEGLVMAGARVRRMRIRYLQRLVPLLKETYRAITDGREEADLIYPPRDSTEHELQEQLRSELKRQTAQEIRTGTTLAGPHRDDILFTVNGLSLRSYGSQGQQRSFLLAFKTAQIMDLERYAGCLPVLLLDDMTGELDRRRQEFFFQFLRERRSQVFVTTTDPQSILNEGFQDVRSFRVIQGTLHAS
jgi:DNA replication and repair protein RecF